MALAFYLEEWGVTVLEHRDGRRVVLPGLLRPISALTPPEEVGA